MTFRVSPSERLRILADAKEAGLKMGTYVRSKLLKEPETKPTHRPTEARLLMKHLIGQIGRVGNNMNQIAFKLNGGAVLTRLDRDKHEEGIRALRDIRSLLISHLLQNNGPC
jgi:hypothetical protein